MTSSGERERRYMKNDEKTQPPWATALMGRDKIPPRDVWDEERPTTPIRGAQRYWGTLALNASIELFSSI